MGSALRKELHRLWMTCVWSWAGWKSSWKSEASLRHWTRMNLASILLACILDLTHLERALIIALGLIVLVVELVNTAIEKAVDHTSTDESKLAESAKDAGSAAVALMAITAGIVWIFLIVNLF